VWVVTTGRRGFDPHRPLCAGIRTHVQLPVVLSIDGFLQNYLSKRLTPGRKRRYLSQNIVTVPDGIHNSPYSFGVAAGNSMVAVLMLITSTMFMIVARA